MEIFHELFTGQEGVDTIEVHVFEWATSYL